MDQRGQTNVVFFYLGNSPPTLQSPTSCFLVAFDLGSIQLLAWVLWLIRQRRRVMAAWGETMACSTGKTRQNAYLT